jgi:hypothetical protein
MFGQIANLIFRDAILMMCADAAESDLLVCVTNCLLENASGEDAVVGVIMANSDSMRKRLAFERILAWP